MAQTHAGEWSPRSIADAIRHPISVRLFAEAPYLAELYRDDLEDRVVHPANVGANEFASPLVLRRGRHRWYLPGNANDLILHTSCVIACRSAVLRYLSPESDAFDCGPPLLGEMNEGSFGFYRTMRHYWARLEQKMEEHMASEFSHVLFADVAGCIENIDPGKLGDLLREAGADHDAISWLDRMHDFWRRSGCNGLPMTPGFRVMLKIYLKAVDERLQNQGFRFLRLQDDFRILCHSEKDARCGRRVLIKGLASRGLALNAKKTHILTRSEFNRSWKRYRIELARVFGEGVGQPALSEALFLPLLRAPALQLLRFFYGHRCQPAFLGDIPAGHGQGA